MSGENVQQYVEQIWKQYIHCRV